MSFYGTVLNNYPESYEPNLGKIQQIEEAFGDINKSINGVNDQISNINNKIYNSVDVQISDINKDISDINTKIDNVNKQISNINNKLDIDNNIIGGYKIYKQFIPIKSAGTQVIGHRTGCGSHTDPNLHKVNFHESERVILLSADTYWPSDTEETEFVVFTVNVMRFPVEASNFYKYYFHCASNKAYNGTATVTVYYIVLNDNEY